ncbi:MAG: hypothetical protein ACJ741_05065 [Pyrinomonadaceae bacterium]
MLFPLIVLWALVGWCGNEPRRLVPTPPKPEPGPDWLVSRVIGAVAGVIGGFAYLKVFGPHPEPWLSAGPQPEPWLPAVFAAATTVGAFVAARIITGIYGQMRGGNVNRG